MSGLAPFVLTPTLRPWLILILRNANVLTITKKTPAYCSRKSAYTCREQRRNASERIVVSFSWCIVLRGSLKNPWSRRQRMRISSVHVCCWRRSLLGNVWWSTLALHVRDFHQPLNEEHCSFPKYCNDSALPWARRGFVTVINLALGTAVGMSRVFKV